MKKEELIKAAIELAENNYISKTKSYDIIEQIVKGKHGYRKPAKEEAEPIIQEITDDIDIPRKKRVTESSYKRFKKKEERIIKKFYKEHRSEKGTQLKRGTLHELVELLPGRSKKAIGLHAFNMGLTKKTRPRGYMKKRKPTLPLTEKDKINYANAHTKGITKKELEFPGIYPLDKSAVKLFEDMLISIIANGGKISYFNAQHLTLVEEKEWSGRVWREFCTQVVLNKKAICKALLCNEKKFKIEMKGEYHYIVYEK